MDTTRLQPVLQLLPTSRAAAMDTARLQPVDTTRLEPVVLQLLPTSRAAAMDTTRLQPVVLQLLPTSRAGSYGHHQASAGGTSTSEPPTAGYLFKVSKFATSRAKKLKDHRLKPGGVSRSLYGGLTMS